MEMSSKPRSEMNDLSHFCYRCGALHISRRRPCGFFIFLYYLRKPRSMPNPFTSPRSGGHLVLLTTSQYFSPLFSTFHQLSFYFFTSTGCRQIYRVPDDLPGARDAQLKPVPFLHCACLSRTPNRIPFMKPGPSHPPYSQIPLYIFFSTSAVYSITRTLTTQNVSTSLMRYSRRVL